MRVIDAENVHRLLEYPALVEAISLTFAAPPSAPDRAHHSIETSGDEPDATLLLMPAWQADGLIGLKSVTVFPGNSARGLPAVSGVYMLFDGGTGAPLALIDGTALTLRRTAAVSALAAHRLARTDARTLLMVGTGALAPHLIAAHAAVREYSRILVWGRSPDKAETLARAIETPGLEIEVALDLDQAVATADVISAATLSTVPLVRGACVRPGTHVDLVGAYRPDMSEADSALLARGRLFVDTRTGALTEAGEIVQAISDGAIGPKAIIGDLFDVVHSPDNWSRQEKDEITVFKAVGTAVSDFAAARLLWERHGKEGSQN